MGKGGWSKFTTGISGWGAYGGAQENKRQKDAVTSKYGLLSISETAKTAMQRQQDVEVELLRAWDTTSTGMSGNVETLRLMSDARRATYVDVGRGIAMQDCDGALVCVGNLYRLSSRMATTADTKDFPNAGDIHVPFAIVWRAPPPARLPSPTINFITTSIVDFQPQGSKWGATGIISLRLYINTNFVAEDKGSFLVGTLEEAGARQTTLRL
ncbi:hypothetical protein EV426DRAFT_578869 [Tirmania nivea]|nr:hypothetical protein EV426DRAFT_578869 [Tirmania nivea]